MIRADMHTQIFHINLSLYISTCLHGVKVLNERYDSVNSDGVLHLFDQHVSACLHGTVSNERHDRVHSKGILDHLDLRIIVLII